jgi:protoheme IX farnesyltransferase
MLLVVFTAICGILLAPGSLHPFMALLSILCIALGSGAAGAINMWYDRDIDSLMKRTAGRPIPQGRISPGDGLAFGMILAVGSVLILGMGVGWVPASLLAFSIFFYTVIYTVILKRSTSQNIVIGGAAGAFPPLIGWATVTHTISLESVWLFLIIFLWTPPHFWALCLCMLEDYKKAKVPMLPLVHGIQSTKVQIFVYSLLLIITTFLGYTWGFYGKIYLAGAVILGGIFMKHMTQILKEDNVKVYMKGFAYSILYLFLIFGLMVVDRYSS